MRLCIPLAVLFSSSTLLAAPGDTTPADETIKPAPLAIDGYCPVSLLTKKTWSAGNTKHELLSDSHRYRFVSEEAKTRFLADTNRFVPALHGNCVVSFKKSAKRVAGQIGHTLVCQQRLFLFASKTAKDEFAKATGKFVDADLAFGGDCSVCLIDANLKKPGTTQYVAHHKGLRYLFPKEILLRKFQANPSRYEDSSLTTKMTAALDEISISGRTACAVCEFGVSPLGAPEKLGFAVHTTDGQIYVVENAHKKYPKLYDKRDKQIKVQLRGKVVKREGKVAWVEPLAVTAVQ